MGSPGDVGPQGSQYGQETERVGKHGQETLFWFLWEKQGEVRQVGLGFGCFESFGWALGRGAVSSCLMPDLDDYS